VVAARHELSVYFKILDEDAVVMQAEGERHPTTTTIDKVRERSRPRSTVRLTVRPLYENQC
jgi:hypothetical protein